MASEINRRTADGGRLFSFRGVTTGLLLTQPLLAASGTFDGRCQPGAAPNTYPRVRHREGARPTLAPVRRLAPRRASAPPGLPARPPSLRGAGPADRLALTRRRSASRRRLLCGGACGRRPGPTARPARPAPAPCPA